MKRGRVLPVHRRTGCLLHRNCVKVTVTTQRHVKKQSSPGGWNINRARGKTPKIPSDTARKWVLLSLHLQEKHCIRYLYICCSAVYWSLCARESQPRLSLTSHDASFPQNQVTGTIQFREVRKKKNVWKRGFVLTQVWAWQGEWMWNMCRLWPRRKRPCKTCF